MVDQHWIDSYWEEKKQHEKLSVRDRRRWTFGDETFRLKHWFGDGTTVYTFDVDKAKNILKRDPRQLETINVSYFYGLMVGLDINIPDAELGDDINLDVPCIAASLNYDDDAILIDGWHRVAKAQKLGIAHLPAYWLEKEETDTIVDTPLPEPEEWDEDHEDDKE